MTPRDYIAQFHADAEAWLSKHTRSVPQIRHAHEQWPMRASCPRCGCWLKIGEDKLCEACRAFVGDKK